tara:strand:- start:237 stop:605 length:369 start_codon:yes stop_codon:yes gene_type:complete
MRKFNKGKGFHGSREISGGKLKGATDTDYLYVFCPRCRDTEILQVLDFTIVINGPVKYAPKARPKAKRDFVIAFELWCDKCKLHDFFKISNIGWQSGRFKNSPINSVVKELEKGFITHKESQ